jgi:hypothetical protein
MKLMDLLLISEEAYTASFPESSLLRLVNRRTGRPRQRLPSPIGDTLALFIVRELSETFDPDASDDEQIAEAIRVLSQAKDDLENMVSALEGRQLV